MSDTPTTEDPPDPFQLLPKAVYRTLVADIYALVPPPTLTDPQLIADRVHSAIATIASMVPANAEECEIALRVVTADAQYKEAIRQARELFNDPTPSMKCQAQASLMMRTANAARTMLLRVQSARRKREAVPAACNQDAWTIHATEALLLAADGQDVPAPPPLPQPESEPTPEPPPLADDDKFARYDEAEQYAIIYPRRAAEIRAHGGVPSTARYGRPEAPLVQQILTSTSPILLQLDKDYDPAAPT
jgi:hypothetical protein